MAPSRVRSLRRAFRRWREEARSRAGAASDAVSAAAGITRSGQAALGAAAGLWLAAWVAAGKVAFLLAYGLVALVLVGRFAAPRRGGLVGGRGGLFPRVMAGESLSVDVAVDVSRRRSAFVLEERLDHRLGPHASFPVALARAGETLEYSYVLRPARRGSYTIGPLVEVAADPLGFTRRATEIGPAVEVIVHPRVDPVPERLLSRQLDDPPIRPPVTRPWPSGLEFHGLREYTPGDDLRRVVWRATARTGTVMVREAEQGTRDRVTVLLDTHRNSYDVDHTGVSDGFESAVRAVASLGVRHLRDGYQVSLHANGGPLARPLRGVAAQIAFLDVLARAETERAPLGDALARLLADPRRDEDLVLATPSMSDEEARRLRMLVARGVSVLVVAVLPAGGEQDDVPSGSLVARAAAIGCRVVVLEPGEDLASAMRAEIGAGTGR